MWHLEHLAMHFTLQQCSSVSSEAGAGKSSLYIWISSAMSLEVSVPSRVANVDGSESMIWQTMADDSPRNLSSISEMR